MNSELLRSPPSEEGSPATEEGSPPTAEALPTDQVRRGRPGRVVVAAAATWLTFTVLHLCLSGRVWLWVIPELLPPIVFLVVPMLLLAAAALLRRGRRWVAATVGPALVLALAFGLTGLTIPRSGASPIGNGDLRIVSWNTEYWHQDDDPDRFYAYLHRQNADVYLLQEYLSWDAAGHQVRQLDDLDRLRREFPGYHIVIAGELATLSRLPVVARYQIGPGGSQPGNLPADQPWFDQFTRDKVLRTDVQLPDGRTMSLYNAHIPVQIDTTLRPTGSAFYSFIRETSKIRHEVYRALADDVAGNRNPMLVAGDFNTSATMADLRILRGPIHRAPLSDAGVYPSSWRASGLRLWRLDWTFVSGSVHADRYRLRSPEGMSDHRLQELEVAVT
jgi:endonuclease/exonuclease/phosphatase (EEP) superfamily protein YafD